MKTLILRLFAGLAVFAMPLDGIFASDSIILWHPSIGTERTGEGAFVSFLHATGAGDDPVTFALVGGEGDGDNARFHIEGDQLRTSESLLEGQYSVRLRAMDQNDFLIEAPLTVSVVPGRVEPKVSAAHSHTALLSSDGTVYTFGFGRLGHGDTESRLAPTAIASEALSGKTIIDVAAGAEHTVLLSADGTVFTFGNGSRGRLGHGSWESQPTPVPVEHENLSGHRITRIAAGDHHTVLISSDGTVFTFGYGNNSRLGHGNNFDLDVPVPITDENLSGYTITEAVASQHTVLLSSAGTVFTFGPGGSGNLGHGDTENRPVPTAIEHESLVGRTITRVAAGYSHTMLLTSDGLVLSFGRGFEGQLGHGDSSTRTVPTLIEGDNLSGQSIIEIAAGGWHSVLRTEGGAVFTFGSSRFSQLGHGDVETLLEPTRIEHDDLAGLTLSGIAAGLSHTLIHTTDGIVFTFGDGRYGQLGHGDTIIRWIPTRIESVNLAGWIAFRVRLSGDGEGMVELDGTVLSGLTHHFLYEPGSEVVLEAIAAEGSFLAGWSEDLKGTEASQTLLLDDHRQVTVAFGSPFIGIRNPVIGVDRASPGALVSRLHAAHNMGDSINFSFVSGEGDDDNGLFEISGDRLLVAETLAEGEYSIRLNAISDSAPAVEKSFMISVVPRLVEAKAAAGTEHTVLLSSEGTVYTFGKGENGRLGHGDTEDRLFPIPIEHENLEGHTIIDVATGWMHTILLSLDGTVFTFGSGIFGQLGHGDMEDRLVPTAVTHEALDGRTIIGIASGSGHTVLLASDGTVLTFGYGGYGQLGQGTVESSLVPAAIEHGNLLGYTLASVAAGPGRLGGRRPAGTHTLLLSSNGTVFSFGSGFGGQLGHRDDSRRLIPTKIDYELLNEHTITDIAAGEHHSVLLSSDGTVFTFGRGTIGRLGHGDNLDRTVPTMIDPVDLSGHAIARIAPGGQHTLLLSDDGTVFSFGRGWRGQLGHGDTEGRIVPEVIEHENLQGRVIADVVAGGSHSVILAADGTVFTFGQGSEGQLGHGDTDDRLVPAPIEFFRLPGFRMYIVDTSGDGQGTVAIDGEPVVAFPFFAQVESGSELHLEASPGENSVFAGWLGDLAGMEADLTINLDSDIQVSALFNLMERLRFDAAMADAGLTGSLAEPDADPFGDGVYNLLKYAFNMSLTGSDHRRLERGAGGNAGLPAVAFEDDTEPALVIEYVRRRNTGLIYTPRVSTDLNTWNVANLQSEVTAINVNWERVIVRIPLDPSVTRAFGSVQVTVP